MNLSIAYADITERKFTDTTLVISDDVKKIELNVHRIILATNSPFFMKMFTFNGAEEKTVFEMTVDHIEIMKEVIFSMYDHPINFNLSKWRHLLELFKCRNYLLMKNDYSKLYNIKVPAKGFLLFMEVLGAFEWYENPKLVRTVKNNLPPDFDPIIFPLVVRGFLLKDEFIVTDDTNGKICLWNLDGTLRGELVDTETNIDTNPNNRNSVILCISRDNQLVISTGIGRTIKIWSVGDMKMIKKIDQSAISLITSVSISFDNTKLAILHRDSGIVVWNLNNTFDISINQTIQTKDTDKTKYNSLINFFNTSNLLAFIEFNKVIIYDLTNKKRIKSVTHLEPKMSGFMIMDNDKKLLTCGFLKINLWDLETGFILREINYNYSIQSFTLNSINEEIAFSDVTEIFFYDSNHEMIHKMEQRIRKNIFYTSNYELIYCSSNSVQIIDCDRQLQELFNHCDISHMVVSN